MVVGILGGIGAGKSAVARLFAEAGARVIDADAHAHEALELEESRKAVRSWWGNSVFDAEGRVDRRAVAERVFSRPEELRRLEALLHPIVLKRIEAEVAEHKIHGPPGALLVLDVPLLLESPLRALCDRLVYVHAPPETRLERVGARGWDGRELARRESLQASAQLKEAAAAHTIDNSSSLARTRRQVEALVENWRQAEANREAAAQGSSGKPGPDVSVSSFSDGKTHEER